MQLVLVGDGVVHQVSEQRLVAGHTSEVALAGTGQHRVTDQALLVEAVAQAFVRLVRVVAELAEQVVGTEELLEVGQFGVGFDQGEAPGITSR